MKRSYFLTVILAAFMLPFSGCVSGKADMERIVAAMDQQDSHEHEGVMRKFIEKARSGDLAGMMALTSKVTIKMTGGEEKQRQHYLSDTIPALKLFGSVAPGGDSKFGPDEYDHYGWAFKRTFLAADGRQAKLQFTIMREDGQLVVAYFGLWQ